VQLKRAGVSFVFPRIVAEFIALEDDGAIDPYSPLSQQAAAPLPYESSPEQGSRFFNLRE